MSKIWRSIAIIGVVIALFAVIILNSSTKQSAADQVWNQAATVGDLESKNFYVMYTDLMCPYCDYFSRAVMDNQAEFEQYLADNNILFEVRLTDYLYEANGSQYSRGGGLLRNARRQILGFLSWRINGARPRLPLKRHRRQQDLACNQKPTCGLLAQYWS